MSESSSHSESDSESSVDIEDIEEDLYALEAEKLRNEAQNTINDELGLVQKLNEIKLRIKGYEPDNIPWSEVLVLTSQASVQSILDDPDDDLTREKVFYQQAVQAIVEGLDKLDDEGIGYCDSSSFSCLGVPYNRPDDYYAEMMKTDEHMKKIKGLLLKEKRQIEESIERRKNRTNKKFAKQLQIQSKQKVFTTSPNSLNF
jgi:rRNA-processing protein EBP2